MTGGGDLTEDEVAFKAVSSRLSKRGSFFLRKANKLVRLQRSKDANPSATDPQQQALVSTSDSKRKKRKRKHPIGNGAAPSKDESNQKLLSLLFLLPVAKPLAVPADATVPTAASAGRSAARASVTNNTIGSATTRSGSVSGSTITTSISTDSRDFDKDHRAREVSKNEADEDENEKNDENERTDENDKTEKDESDENDGKCSEVPIEVSRAYSGRIKNYLQESSPHKDALVASRKPDTMAMDMSPRKQSILRHKQNDGEDIFGTFKDAKDNLRNSLVVDALNINSGSYNNNSNGNSNNTSSNTSSNTSNGAGNVSHLATLNLDDKVTVFAYHSSQILVYQEHVHVESETGSISTTGSTDANPKTSGRLLGHGPFEIFQLHNGDITYLSCGNSFVYPLLPKLKILRVSFNTFVLPLVNPDRYWKILLETADESVISSLEEVLNQCVRYANLYFGPGSPKPLATDIFGAESSVEPSSHENNKSEIEEKPKGADASGANSSKSSTQSQKSPNTPLLQTMVIPEIEEPQLKEPTSEVSTHIPFSDKNATASVEHSSGFLGSEIPDSPPSAPISPSRAVEYTPIKRQPSTNSFTTDLACLDLNDTGPSLLKIYTMGRIEHPSVLAQIRHPIPHRIQNPSIAEDIDMKHIKQQQSHHQDQPLQYQNRQVVGSVNGLEAGYHRGLKEEDVHGNYNDSDSSLDSLIDEYEENIISTSKSLQVGSRSQSRAPSQASTSFIGGVQYTRPAYFQGKIDTDAEDFPTTSLSEYNRVHNGADGMSRRSSRSGVDWPATNSSKLIKSRSNYSIASTARGSQYNGSHLSNTYKEIYKSISERNLAQNLGSGHGNGHEQPARKGLPHHHDMRSKHPPLSRSAFTPVSISTMKSRNGSSRNGSAGGESGQRYANSVVTDRPAGMTSSEVFKMLSQTKSKQNLREPREFKQETVEEEKGFASRIFGW